MLDSRKLILPTADPGLRLIIVRASDVPTYVQYGAADLGVAGKDVLLEHGGDGLYQPIDLGIGRCRMCVAVRSAASTTPPRCAAARACASRPSTSQVAREHFAAKGVHVDLIKLYGSMELAPLVGLADAIVDLVSTGSTLRPTTWSRSRRSCRSPRAWSSTRRRSRPGTPSSRRCSTRSRARWAPRRPDRAAARPQRRWRHECTRPRHPPIDTPSPASTPLAALLAWEAEQDEAIERAPPTSCATCAPAATRRCSSTRAASTASRSPTRARSSCPGAELEAALACLGPARRDALRAPPTRPRAPRAPARAVVVVRRRRRHRGSARRSRRSTASGLYVPGGKAAYPSSVLMNAMPAKVAGVPELVMVTPTPGGERNPLVLAAAAIAGVDRVFTIGGAQAVGALAYGTATVPRSTRSSVPATPTSPRPSGACSAPSAST
jgi:ATP phosphoribosyltransferase